MLSSRGAFIAIGGILLLSIGLSAKGIGTVTTMLPILFGQGLLEETTPEGGNSTVDLGIFQVFEILNSSPIVDYGMFLGTLLHKLVRI